MSLPAKLQETLDLLALLPDRNDRIDLLISVADRFESVPERIARRPFAAEHRVPQCESEAYVWAERRDDGHLDFHFAVENPQGIAAKAWAALLQKSLSGADLQTIADIPSDVVYELFGRELSMGKSLGLMGTLQMCQAYAKKA